MLRRKGDALWDMRDTLWVGSIRFRRYSVGTEMLCEMLDALWDVRGKRCSATCERCSVRCERCSAICFMWLQTRLRPDSSAHNYQAQLSVLHCKDGCEGTALHFSRVSPSSQFAGQINSKKEEVLEFCCNQRNVVRPTPPEKSSRWKFWGLGPRDILRSL